ncbi:MAG: hypothetical protein IKK08_03580 [Clostridia bacterium]|nr:hypothetical protein [Clostridia bacterium]
MKYRTDFVTNSSSSSFTIHIALETVDDCTIWYENTGSEEAGYDVELYLSPRQMGRAESIDALIALLQGEGTNDGFWEEPPPWEYPEDDEEDFCDEEDFYDEDEVCNADGVSGESGNSGEDETSDAGEAGKADEPSGEDAVAGEAVESSVEEETSDAGATEVADEFSDEDEITAAEAFIEQLRELGSMDRIKSITVTGHEGGWLSANHFQQYVYDRVSGRYSGRVWGKPNPKGQAGCLRFSDVDECGME